MYNVAGDLYSIAKSHISTFMTLVQPVFRLSYDNFIAGILFEIYKSSPNFPVAGGPAPPLIRTILQMYIFLVLITFKFGCR